jgi:hypothetical protein
MQSSCPGSRDLNRSGKRSILTHCGQGHLNCLNSRSRGLNNLNQLLYCVCLRIYNKFTDYFCVIKCIVRGNQARVKNAYLRHPPCTVVMCKRKSASPVHNVLRLLSRVEAPNHNCMYCSFAPYTPHIFQFHSALEVASAV